MDAPPRVDKPVRSAAKGVSAPTRRARAMLAVGAVVVAAGVALVGTAHPDSGGLVLLAGWGVLAAALHRFGRSESS